MLTIGELAQAGGVSVRMLRHYDSIGLLRPARVESRTGHRYYAASQIGELNRIVAMRDLGFGLEEIGELVRAVTVADLRAMFLLRRSDLSREMNDNRRKLTAIEARLRLIEREDRMPDYEIVEKRLPALRVGAVTMPMPKNDLLDYRDVGDMLDELWPQLTQAMRATKTKAIGPPLAFGATDPRTGSGAMFAAVPVSADEGRIGSPGMLLDLPPIEHAAVVVRTGPLDATYPEIYRHVAEWIEEHGYVQAGPGREVFIHVPNADTDPPTGDVVLEIQRPLRRPDDPDVDIQPRLVPAQS